MAETTMVRIPKELSNGISIIKVLNPKINLTKEEWVEKILMEGLKKYDKKLEKFKFR